MNLKRLSLRNKSYLTTQKIIYQISNQDLEIVLAI
jgi:hypothetical protein